MKFKKGDKVWVRKDLKDGKRYGIHRVVPPMLRFAGKVVTIRKVNFYGKNSYCIEEDDYGWTPEMFECKILYIKNKRVKV